MAAVEDEFDVPLQLFSWPQSHFPAPTLHVPPATKLAIIVDGHIDDAGSIVVVQGVESVEKMRAQLILTKRSMQTCKVRNIETKPLD